MSMTDADGAVSQRLHQVKQSPRPVGELAEAQRGRSSLGIAVLEQIALAPSLAASA